jgi:general secretion pathway protein L
MASEQTLVLGETFQDMVRFVLRNWHDELALYFAERWPSLAPSQERLVLEFTGDEMTFCNLSKEGREELGRFRRAAESIEPVIVRLAQSGHLVRGKADVELRLAPNFVLRPELRLPKASPSALRGALGFELERISPVAPSELYFDSVETHFDKPTNRVSLVVRAVRRSDVDGMKRLCRAMGLSVSTISFEGDGRPADARYFPLDRAAVARTLWKRWGAGILGALALILIIAIAFAGASRLAASNEALSSAVATESVRAAAVERLLQKIQTIHAQSAYVVQRRRAPLFVETLANLVDVLPEGTWVDQVSLNGSKLHLQGYSHAAAELIGRFDRSGHFANAQFGAPLVRSASDSTERFDLSADLVGKP